MSAPLTLNEFGARMIALLPRVMREFARHESRYITQGQISPPQVVVLDHLKHNGPCPMSELAAVVHLKCSSATSLVDRLVRDKLVKRLADEEDRRVVQVEITAKGKTILKEIFRQKQKAMISLFTGLSAQERAMYLAIHEKIYRNLGSARVKGDVK